MAENELVAGSSSDRSPSVEHGTADFYDDSEYVDRHLNVGEVLAMWNLVRLIRELGTMEQCIAFSEDQGLLKHDKRCPDRSLMKI